MVKRAAKQSRRGKVNSDQVKPQTKEKFLETARSEGTQPNLPKFEPKTDNQRLALSYLEEGAAHVFLRGSAGTGKSMTAVYHACRQLKSKRIDKIYLIRPAVTVGKSLGALPGTLEEKLAPYFAQTVSRFNTFMGKGYTGYCLHSGVIEMHAVEYLRGASLEDCIAIFEETQNFTEEEWEMVMSRLGEGAQFIYTGDERQNDLKGRSGLSITVGIILDAIRDQNEYLDDDDLDNLEDHVRVVTFTPDDVVRHGVTKAIVKIYYHRK